MFTSNANREAGGYDSHSGVIYFHFGCTCPRTRISQSAPRSRTASSPRASVAFPHRGSPAVQQWAPRTGGAGRMAGVGLAGPWPGSHSLPPQCGSQCMQLSQKHRPRGAHRVLSASPVCIQGRDFHCVPGTDPGQVIEGRGPWQDRTQGCGAPQLSPSARVRLQLRLTLGRSSCTVQLCPCSPSCLHPVPLFFC